MLDLVTPIVKRDMVDSLNRKKYCIIDVKASFYECSFLLALIFREANALAKFAASLRSFNLFVVIRTPYLILFRMCGGRM